MSRLVPILWSLLSIAVCSPVWAQAIGDATSVVRDVRGVIDGRPVTVTVGDTVYRDQTLRTLADSSAVVTFLDKTGMAIGPLTEVRLDEFVFSAKAGPRTLDAVKGIFRFISGPGETGHDYKVRTPHATIAVRGTTFDVRVTETQTTVVLHEGAIDVCNAGGCKAVKPGETVNAARNVVQTPRPQSPADWTFTTPARREQKAALDRAETVLRTTSAAHHAAFAQKQAAAAARVSTPLAARKDAVAAPAPAMPKAAPQPGPERVDTTRAAVPASPEPVIRTQERNPAVAGPAERAEPVRAALADSVPQPGAAVVPAAPESDPVPPAPRPAAETGPRLSLPSGSVIAGQTDERPVVTTTAASRQVLAQAGPGLDRAILVAQPSAPLTAATVPNGSDMPLLRSRVRDGPPLRPG